VPFLACLSANQAQSLSMSEKLKNRQAVQNSLHKIVKELAIPPDMIEYVPSAALEVGTAPFFFWELTRHIMNHFLKNGMARCAEKYGHAGPLACWVGLHG
jgi:hypothetical protein